MTKKLPETLPWEKRQDHHYKLGIAVILIFTFGVIVGANITRDPNMTAGNSNGNSSTGSNGSHSGNTNNVGNSSILIPPANVSGMVILPSARIASGQQYQLKFSTLFWATLVPRWTNGSGWITVYTIMLPPQTYNVTSPGCSPLKLVSATINSDGTVSWSIINYPAFTSIVAVTAKTVEADFECGIL